MMITQKTGTIANKIIFFLKGKREMGGFFFFGRSDEAGTEARPIRGGFRRKGDWGRRKKMNYKGTRHKGKEKNKEKERKR
jgi:hypothetical protein